VDPDIANKDAMTIFINFRIYDYDKKFIGATGVGLTVNAVNQLIETYQQKYNRTIYFIDKTGVVKLSGSQFDKSVKNISQLTYASKLNNPLGTNFEQLFSYQKDGQTIHTNIRYIEEFKWHLVVEQPENEMIRQIYTTLIINLLICLAVTLFILMLVNYSIKAYQKKIDTLRGIVPICSYCKQIRDDKGYWNRVEAYVAKYTEAQFSHSICPECIKKYHPKEYEYIKRKHKADTHSAPDK
ncbi:MAG: cache domain-containing protein, partial [Pseudomonadota bacterium]